MSTETQPDYIAQAEMAWSTRFEVAYGLRWDPDRQVCAATDGFAYDGERLYSHARQGGRG